MRYKLYLANASRDAGNYVSVESTAGVARLSVKLMLQGS